MAFAKEADGQLSSPSIAPRSWRKINPEALVAYVKDRPDKKLEDYAENFQASPSGVWRALQRLKITRKKRPLSTKKETKVSAQNF